MITIPKKLEHDHGVIGRPIPRVDGPAKVTGQAKYAGDFGAEELLHGYVVTSAIAKGVIKSIDASAALAMPGVVQVFTHENRPGVAWFDYKWKDPIAPQGSPFRPLYDDKIHFSLQPVALVVADTYELARAAARAIKITYDDLHHETHVFERLDQAEPVGTTGSFTPPPKPRGDADKAIAESPVKIDSTYVHATEHHNPIELFATTAVVEEDGTYTVYDKIQGVSSSQQYLCNVFGLKPEQVRVKSPFVGGAFGSGLRPQYQVYLAMLAATQLQRSVRVMLTRPEMWALGHRPATWQHVALSAAADGTLTGMIHDCIGETSQHEDYAEIVVNWSGQQYRCDNVRLTHKNLAVDTSTPMSMRAPGAATGCAALEVAVDELCTALKMDPVEWRLKNLSDHNQNLDQPFSSKELPKALREGAEKFGWSKRNPAIGSMRTPDGKLIGYGVAVGAWDAQQGQAAAKAVLSLDGRLRVSSATADIGTGTYTVMTQIAADTLGLSVDRVTFKLGDTALPMAPIEGGSWTVSSVGSAVKAACDAVCSQLLKAAQSMPQSPFKDASFDDVTFEDAHLVLKSDGSKRVSFAEAMRAAGLNFIEEQARALPNYLKQRKYTRSTHVATFVEVHVDEASKMVNVARVLSCVAAGRIINPKTAGNQVKGAVVWGISQALHEESVMDHRLGRYMNHDLAEYHVATNKDAGEIEVIFVEEHDEIVNPLGAKGVGEIGLVSVAPAILNAIHHATGVRVRDLPTTLDALL